MVGAVFCQRLPGRSRSSGRRGPSETTRRRRCADRRGPGHVAGAKVFRRFCRRRNASAGRAAPAGRVPTRHAVWQMATSSTASASEAGAAVARSETRLRPSLHIRHAIPPTFYATLLRCHDDSLDCPELHGVRTPDEVLAGYRDCAPDPASWWLARRGRRARRRPDPGGRRVDLPRRRPGAARAGDRPGAGRSLRRSAPDLIADRGRANTPAVRSCTGRSDLRWSGPAKCS